MRHSQKKITKEPSGRVRVQTINELPSMAQQQFKDECDINNIMKKYQSTGQFLHTTSKQGRYADFSDIKDYQEMLDTVRYADAAFLELPAQVRARFQNNPAELLSFLQDKSNYDEGVKLGLLQPKPTTPTEQPTTETKTKTKPKTETE